MGRNDRKYPARRRCGRCGKHRGQLSEIEIEGIGMQVAKAYLQSGANDGGRDGKASEGWNEHFVPLGRGFLERKEDYGKCRFSGRNEETVFDSEVLLQLGFEAVQSSLTGKHSEHPGQDVPDANRSCCRRQSSPYAH